MFAAYKMRLDTAKEIIYVCDGDKSLWKIKEEHFGEAKGMLDWDHISCNLNKALRIIEDKGKRIWDRYFRHLITDMPRNNFFTGQILITQMRFVIRPPRPENFFYDGNKK